MIKAVLILSSVDRAASTNAQRLLNMIKDASTRAKQPVYIIINALWRPRLFLRFNRPDNSLAVFNLGFQKLKQHCTHPTDGTILEQGTNQGSLVACSSTLHTVVLEALC